MQHLTFYHMSLHHPLPYSSHKQSTIITNTYPFPDPVETAFKALTPSEKTSYRSLHAYRPQVLRDTLNRSIMYTNGFHIGSGNDKTGVFLLASRFNHSCVANTRYVWHDAIKKSKINENGEVVEEIVEEGRMVFTTYYKLLDGEEVTIDYGHKPSVSFPLYEYRA